MQENIFNNFKIILDLSSDSNLSYENFHTVI